MNRVLYSVKCNKEFPSGVYLDEEVELPRVIGGSNDLLCSKTPRKPFRPVQNTLSIPNSRGKNNTNTWLSKRTEATLTWCQVSWQTLTLALQSRRLPSFCCLPPPCRRPRASSRNPRSAPAKSVWFTNSGETNAAADEGDYSHGTRGCQLAPRCCHRGPPTPSTSQGTQPCLEPIFMKRTDRL